MVNEIRTDLHVHTAYSCDAEAEMEQYVKSAIEKHLQALCFTDYVDFNPNDYGSGYYNAEKYFHEFEMILNHYGDI